jgi:hypothetical protein
MEAVDLVPKGGAMRYKRLSAFVGTLIAAGVLGSGSASALTFMTFISPVAGATVSGTVTVMLSPTNAAYAGVYACGGQEVGEPSPSTGWTVQWNTTTCADGNTTIAAYSYNSNGTELDSVFLDVTVNNAAPPPPAQCADGLDNDSDGKIDYPADPGCDSALDENEVDPIPGGEPGPIAGQGYSKVFGDEFAGTALDAAVWTPKEFWEDEPRPGAVVVSNGTVKINNARPYYGDQSITTGPYWGGEPAKKTWMFGYFEARMKFTDAKGSWPAFWMISAAHATWPNWPACPEPDLNFELDIMEYQGDERTQFYGTEHRNTGGVCGVPDLTRSVFTNPGVLAGTWHTFSVKWTATTLTWYVDDLLQGSQPLFVSGDQQMYIALTMQACGWDPTNACDAATPDPLVTEVDWVHVWQQ